MPEPSTVERPIDLVDVAHALTDAGHAFGRMVERVRVTLAAQAALGRLLADADDQAAELLDTIPAEDLDRVGQAAAALATACGLRLAAQPTTQPAENAQDAPTDPDASTGPHQPAETN